MRLRMQMLATVGLILSLLVEIQSFHLPSGYLCSLHTEGDGWFLYTPDQSLAFILVDHGFDVWVRNVCETRSSHGDLVEMMKYINSVTNSKLFVLGHSQGKSFAVFTQLEIAEKVEAAALGLAKDIQQLNHKRTRFKSTTPTLLHHNDLAHAEAKAKNPTLSSFQPQQTSRQQFQDIAMALLFVIGYAGIILEQYLAFNKSGVGLLMAVSLWVVRSIGAPSTDIAVSELIYASAEVGEIVFFLLGAMTIVEVVDVHQGFKLVTDNITTRSPRLLLWVIGFVTFFLSSVLDSLASTIVMISLLRKLVPPTEYQKILGAVVVIAANAGGAWSPIGAVTTTMLWIHGQISALQTIKGLFVPSVISLAVPLVLMSLTSGVNGKGQNSPDVFASEQIAPRGQLVFSVSFGALIFVPVFKALTGLPPYMGMLLGLGVLWIFTDAIHYGESERQKLKVPQALSRIDTQGALFFLGILLSVSSLEAAGILREIANYFDARVPSSELIASAIGMISAVIDNVPLVAATMAMYDVSSFPQDSEFWQLIALCASTGGSILIIGSAAGVAFMGMQKVDFVWYLRKVSGFALAGYAAGIATYLALHKLNISQPTPTEVSSLSNS
ncbi:sodium/proton antiporter 1 isoform X2 [Cajanus cajan]|uniref:sodium/proton antiporter 1 isoform X2 n=1 Tax=Cajanus cajan TaxID=3821 RepID=UPI0010FB629A|nr:sodium/proton antiporter 1 isoform X2 [Cajanus cajan]